MSTFTRVSFYSVAHVPSNVQDTFGKFLIRRFPALEAYFLLLPFQSLAANSQTRSSTLTRSRAIPITMTPSTRLNTAFTSRTVALTMSCYRGVTTRYAEPTPLFCIYPMRLTFVIGFLVPLQCRQGSVVSPRRSSCHDPVPQLLPMAQRRGLFAPYERKGPPDPRRCQSFQPI